MNRLKLWSEQKGHTVEGPSAMASSSLSKTSRPAPLRTVATYDDDMFFQTTSLNMLSRYEGLNLSAAEVISSVLASPRSQSSFLEGLNSRLARSSHLSPSAQELLLKANHVFGPELRKIVGNNTFASCERGLPPTTPRNISCPSSEASSQHSSNSSGKKKRSFFPDCDMISGGLFRSRKVKNIDWNLVEAIEQVESLRLDGNTAGDRPNLVGYRPPPKP